MKKEEKTEYMRIACNIAGYNLNEKDIDMILSLNELVNKYKGKTDLKMVLQVKQEVKERADAKSRSNLLDKFSEEQ